MKVLVTGATGFVGKKLARSLVNNGHSVSVLTRDTESARKRLPLTCEFHKWEPSLYPPSSQAFDEADAVIHLAGENIADGRWTSKKKNQLKIREYYQLEI